MNHSMAFLDIVHIDQISYFPPSFVLIHTVYMHHHVTYADVSLNDTLAPNRDFLIWFIVEAFSKTFSMEILFHFGDCCHPEITQQKNDILFILKKQKKKLH
jgi:hypothetical protein